MPEAVTGEGGGGGVAAGGGGGGGGGGPAGGGGGGGGGPAGGGGGGGGDVGGGVLGAFTGVVSRPACGAAGEALATGMSSFGPDVDVERTTAGATTRGGEA